MTLDQLPVDAAATIVEVDTRSAVMLRIMEMGLVPGAPVRIRKRAPFGGPLQIQVHNYVLSIRSNEAQKLIVETSQPS